MDGFGSSGTGSIVLAGIGPSQSLEKGRNAAERSLKRGRVSSSLRRSQQHGLGAPHAHQTLWFLNTNQEGQNLFYSVKEPHLSSIMAYIQSRI